MGSRYPSIGHIQHQSSAKQLINRYESIGSPRTRRHTGNISPPRTPPRQGTHTKKDKSPLRQSFQNIVTAFKKGARAIGSRHESESPVLPRKVDTNSLYNPEYSGQPSRPPTPPSKCPRLSGKILHLSTEPMGLAWRPCAATMGATSISLCHSQGSSQISTISLLQCIEVRSSQFDCKYLLDRNSIGITHVEDLRAFELIYDGKPTERFACFSIQERAMWIDTIWDAIISLHGSTRKMNILLGQGDQAQDFQPMGAIPYVLQSDRPHAYQAMDAVHLRGIPPQGDRVQEHQRMEVVHPTSHIPPALPAKDLNARDPQPVSQASAVVANHRLLPPLVIANGCPSLSTSSGTTSSDSSHLRSRSPSIANLDSLSVVKQRLAQIQSPTKDTGMPPPTAFSRLPSPQKLKLPKQDDMTPLSAYDANDTILDYYRGNGNDDDRYSSTVVPVTPQDIPRQQDYGPIVNIDISQRHDAVDTAGQISGLPPYCTQMTDIVSGPQPRSSFNNADSSSHLLETINAKLEALVNQPSEKDAQLSKLLPSIRELAQQLDSSRREQAAKLDTILSATTTSGAPPAHDSSAILNKLDKLIETQRNSAARSDDPAKHAQLEQLVGLLRADITDRASQIHQQADSVRYLNELNSWLEAFVSNGTTQIQGLAANVEALCQSMGCSADAQGLPYDGLREDIHRFILETRARDENVATIHHNMMALLNEQRQGSVNAPHDLIAGIMHQQRRDHEAMLSALVHEVSSEIRGERLRFVEAMKEATQINVQMHVDQFKRELNKEVVTMTKEVQRLHNEKKAMENQIAELFSFYSKRAPAEFAPGQLHFSR